VAAALGDRTGAELGVDRQRAGAERVDERPAIRAGQDAGAAAIHAPVGRVAHAHEREARPPGAQREGLRRDLRQPADAVGEAGRAAHLEDPPVTVGEDRSQIRQPAADQARLGPPGRVERDIRQRHIAHSLASQPREVARRCQRPLLVVAKERVVLDVELGDPATRERDGPGDVHRFPVQTREGHLDADRGVGARLQEVQQRLVVGGLRRGIDGALDRLAHRRPPLPHEQGDDRCDQHEPPASAIARGQHGADEQRPGERDAEATGVLAHRRRDDERQQRRAEVDHRAGAQRPLALGQQPQKRRAAQHDRQQRAARERLASALGKQERERDRRRHRGSPDPQADAPARRQPVRRAGHRQKQPGDGTGERAGHGQSQPQPVLAQLQGIDGAERHRQAERERQAPDQEVGDGADGEPQSADASGARSEVLKRDALEQQRRGNCREDADDAHAKQRPERRKDNRVGGRVVTAVPVEVDQREALALEQAGAVDLGSEVGGVGPDEQPHERQRSGEQPGRDPAGGHRRRR